MIHAINRLTLFSWGFAGWGNATRELVACVDAAEKQRGFAPPMFVDIRLRRSGRAIGFRDDAFEQAIGWRRYRWMPTLGNSSIGTRKPMAIAAPESVNYLIDTAGDASDRGARVIFFCACGSPWRRDCHRHLVARLLRRAARLRHLPIHVQEWPGGARAKQPIDLRVSLDLLTKATRGAKAIPLGGRRVPVAWTGLPWGTLVSLRAGQERMTVAAGPALYRAGHWMLPLFREDERPWPDVDPLRHQVERMRRKYDLA